MVEGSDGGSNNYDQNGGYNDNDNNGDIENNNDNNLPTKRDFKRYLEKQYGKSKIKGDKMFDYKFKSTYQKVSHGNSLSLIGSFN